MGLAGGSQGSKANERARCDGQADDTLMKDLVAPSGSCRYLKTSLIFWGKKRGPLFHSQQIKGELDEDVRKNIRLYDSFHNVLQASETMEVTVFDFANLKK